MAAGILSIFEPFAEEAVKAMAPDIEALFKKLVPGSVSPAPTSGAEVAVASNFQKALPSVTAPGYKDVLTKAGVAVAQFMTSNPTANLQADDTFSLISSLVLQGITSLGLNASMVPPVTLKDIVAGAINMYIAGVGVKAESVTASSSAAS